MSTNGAASTFAPISRSQADDSSRLLQHYRPEADFAAQAGSQAFRRPCTVIPEADSLRLLRQSRQAQTNAIFFSVFSTSVRPDKASEPGNAKFWVDGLKSCAELAGQMGLFGEGGAGRAYP